VRASNEVSESEDSPFLEVALVDVPTTPTAPSKLSTFTSQEQIGIEWPIVADQTSPGGEILGYVVYMYDPALGTWETKYDGSDGYSGITS